MKLNKKIAILSLSSLLVLSIAGCGSSDSDNKETTTAPATESTTTKEQPVEQQAEDEQLVEQQAEEVQQPEENIPTEYKSALIKAKQYSDMMHMSKAGLYDQLTSQYGEKFSPEAAQYAVDNVEADWNANALQKAKDYQDQMAMSPDAIYDQLISDYGEKFTPEEAQYAVDNLN